MLRREESNYTKAARKWLADGANLIREACLFEGVSPDEISDLFTDMVKIYGKFVEVEEQSNHFERTGNTFPS